MCIGRMCYYVWVDTLAVVCSMLASMCWFLLQWAMLWGGGSQMRANNARSIIGAYHKNHSPSLTSFLKRLTGYLAATLVVYAYGKPTTALVVLGVLIAIDLVLTLAFSTGYRL